MSRFRKLPWYEQIPQTKEMKHVDAVASMAWALAVANIQSASLQIKVAKGIIAHIDKVTPPEIGDWVTNGAKKVDSCICIGCDP